MKTSLQQIIYKSKRSSDYDIKDISYFGYDAEVFWRKISPNFDLIIERNQEYLNYRYCDSRAGDYKVKAVYRRDEMLGYCVLDLTQRNQAKILDFMTLSGEKDAADTLLLHVLDYITENKRNSVILWVVNNSEFYRVFMRNNFVKAKEIRPHLYFNSRVVEMEEWDKIHSLNPKRVHFVLGDTDIC